MSSDVSSTFSQRNLNVAKSNSDVFYEFEDFRLDAARLMLYRGEEPVALKPKVVETLVALLEHRGEVISKEELMTRLWADTFVEESNLTQNIYLLRKTLGNGADGKPLIETFRRRGYRFTGAVKTGVQDTSTTEIQTIQPLEKTPLETEKTPPGVEIFDSLAVLPFVNQSADPNAEYLSDGITESIINRLTQISRLRVVARNTVFQYKNKDTGACEIGRDLGVSAVLTGRILQHEERLIVRAELVDASKGWQIWGEQYDRPAADVLELQATIAGEISENLRLKLTGEERRRVLKRYTENSEAYDLYIKARFYLNKRLTETIEQAAALYQQAIRIDPIFAPAYVGLADCYPLLSLYGALSPQEAYPKAKAAALKALEIDDEYTKAYNSLGVVKLFYDWDWAGAEEAFRRAIELNPGYPDAHQRYGMLLTTLGRFDEAVVQFKHARELDPLSLITRTIGGYAFYYSRQYELAAASFREVIALDPAYSMAHFRLGLTYAAQKKYRQAMAEIEQAIALSDDRDTIAALGYAAGLAGEKTIPETALAELAERERKGFVTSYNRVIVNVGLGDRKTALDWLERAYQERSYWLIYLKVDPALDALRDEPRFAKLEEKIFGSPLFQQTGQDAAIKESDVFERSNNLPESPAGTSRFTKKSRYLWVAAGFCLILLAYYFLPKTVIDHFFARDGAALPADPKFTRLMPDLNVSQSTFLPGGKSLAYTVTQKGKQSVWEKNLETGAEKQILPPTETGYGALRFSSDGRSLFYLTNRKDAPNGTIVRHAFESGAAENIVSNVAGTFSLSPDEQTISYINGDYELCLVSPDGSDGRVLARRDPQRNWYNSWSSQLSWSPDGRRIAVTGARRGAGGKEIGELIEIDAATGAERIVPTPEWNALDDAAYLKDGSGLIIAARETEVSPFQIWFVPVADGAARRITNGVNEYEDIAVSPDNRLMVIHQKYSNLNLFLSPADDLANEKQITFGANNSDGYWGVAFTPAGKLIYTSPRGGNVDLWQMNADGSELRQLTRNFAEWNARPVTTIDGRYIVFASTRSGTRQIWRVDADGGNPQQLTELFRADHPFPAPDGKWIYFTAFDAGRTAVYKIPVEGGQVEAVSESDVNVAVPVVSPDGKFIFVETHDRSSPQPWKSALLSAETGKIIKFFDFHAGVVARWPADSKTVFYMVAADPDLWRVSIETEKSERISNFETGQIRSFAFFPATRQLVVSRGAPSTEAVLVEGFLPAD